MKITKLSYSEFPGDPKEWTLKDATFKNVNLVVGKNGSGKTRLLNVISGLSRLLSGQNRKLYSSAFYKVEFEGENNSTFKYELNMSDSEVKYETLSKNGRTLLKRDSNGEGKLWAEEEGKEIKFQVPNEDLVAVTRQDKIQHPFFIELSSWAKSVKHYKFGEQLGKNTVYTIINSEDKEDKDTARTDELTVDPEKVAAIYRKAYELYGEDYDNAVIGDMNEIGYPCSDVGLITSQDIVVQGLPAAVLFVKEDDLPANTMQLQMSQGMFRAFSLLIQINYSIFSGKHTSILIDDIGEGLDFDRSTKLIEKILKHSGSNQFHLIMTTNDRYVMNSVDLDLWSIIQREGNEVRLLNSENSKEIFEKFEFVGLNNFDFFSSGFYLGEEDD
jgi:AAA15 family ATPase/GTPase